MFLKSYKEISNKFHQGALTITFIFGGGGGGGSNFWRSYNDTLTSWSKFFKSQSTCILAIRCDRRQERVSIPKYSLK